MNRQPMTSAFPTFAAAPRTLPRALWRAATWLWRKLWRPPAIVLAVLIVAHVTLNVISGRRLEAELNKLRARGAPLTLAEAAPSSVPDSQNAAVLYLRAFAQLGSRSEQETIQRVVRPLRRASYPSPPTPTLAQVEPIIARHVAQFRLLREASLRPACHFPVDWNDAGGATSWHPAGMRDASDLLAAKAVVDANRGRSGDALDDLAIIMRMGNHLSAEPTLISQLVRSEVSVGEVFRVLPRVMAAAPPDAAQSRAFHDLLAKVDMVGPWVHAMEGERCFGLAVFDQFRHAKSGDGLMGMLGLSEAQSSREMLSATISRFLMRHAWPLTRAVWTPFLNLDEVLFLRRAQRAIELAAKPYRVSLRDQEALEDARGRLPWYGRVSAIASPVYAHATAARDKAIAQIGLMQAAMALRAYQIAHGSYPASLAEARAAGGWAVPDDPFSGEPFIYHRRGAGYFIYSVAEDMKNDQGIDKHTALALAPVSGRLQAAKGPKAGRRQLQPTWDVPLRMER